MGLSKQYSLSAPKSQRFLRFAIAMPIADPEIAQFPKQEKALRHCDLRVRWKVASDLRFRAAISEPKTPSFCGISGDLAQSTRKSLAIAIVRFWCAKSIPLPFPKRFLGTSQPCPSFRCCFVLSTGRIHHVIWFLSAKIWPKKAKNQGKTKGQQLKGKIVS